MHQDVHQSSMAFLLSEVYVDKSHTTRGGMQYCSNFNSTPSTESWCCRVCQLELGGVVPAIQLFIGPVLYDMMMKIWWQCWCEGSEKRWWWWWIVQVEPRVASHDLHCLRINSQSVMQFALGWHKYWFHRQSTDITHESSSLAIVVQRGGHCEVVSIS
jgi:hypothetical protein